MGKEIEDKAGRILAIYSRLKQGKTIFKQEESRRYGVALRTIQRDIADIQCFLQDQTNETGEIQEVMFDKKSGGYILQTKSKQQLEEKEILAVAKVLLESRGLVKDELFPIIHKLIRMCSNDSDKKHLEDVLKNEMFHYVELRHGKRLLDKLWELEQAVTNQKYIEIEYQKLKNQELVTRKVKPVGIMFSEYYFYLTAFIDDKKVRENFYIISDAFPTIYRIDRIKNLKVLDETFYIPYKNRFEEGEFRKRIQFMYGGKLQKVKFKYFGNDIDAVLDRLPTADILEEDHGIYTVSAEIFGKGIDMWFRSQGDMVEVLP